MRFYHDLFKPLHFDYGSTKWSVNYVPLFSSILSVLDHRRLNTIHNITFYSMMKVLTNDKITKKQAQAMFDHIDLGWTGDLGYSELGFLTGLIVAHKDHMEREFLYMNSWKIWVTFNEHGRERISTTEFRRTGLFFDFDYPTMYETFRDYHWNDEQEMEFERFRFYLMSCIHLRQLKRFQAKYIRYRQFKTAVLLLLNRILKSILVENIYPSPFSILKAIQTIKIPPLEGTERKHWTEIFKCAFLRTIVRQRWDYFKTYWSIKAKEVPSWLKCLCICVTCGCCCCDDMDQERKGCCGDCDQICSKACQFRCFPCKKKAVRRPRPDSEMVNPPKLKQLVKQRQKAEAEGYTAYTGARRSSMGSVGRWRRAKTKRQMIRAIRREEKRKGRLRHKEQVPVIEWKPLGKPLCIIL